jgi:predicted phosphodiesterase
MRLGLVSDVHWMSEPPVSSSGWHGAGAEFRGVLDRLAQALAFFAGEQVDVIALAGDLSHHGEEDSIIAVLRCCAYVGVPVLAVSGNHDVAGDEQRFARAHWRADPRDVALATTGGEIHGGVRVAGVQVGDTEGWFAARLRSVPDTIEWGDEPVVLIGHYPVLSLAADVSAAGLPYPGDLVDRQILANRLLARAAPTVAVGGHVHARASRSEDSVLQVTCGALVEAPYECAIVEIIPEPTGSLFVRRRSRRLLPAATGSEPVFTPDIEEWRYSPNGEWARVAVSVEESFVP